MLERLINKLFPSASTKLGVAAFLCTMLICMPILILIFGSAVYSVVWLLFSLPIGWATGKTFALAHIQRYEEIHKQETESLKEEE